MFPRGYVLFHPNYIPIHNILPIEFEPPKIFQQTNIRYDAS